MAAMHFFLRRGFLAFILVAGVFVVAQNNPESVGAITSALRAGQFDRALELLQPELAQSPKSSQLSSQLWTLRGIAYSGKGDKREALIAFRHALGISPDYLPALEGAAQIEYENGGKDAAQLLEHVLQLRPQDPTSHAMLAVLAYRRADCTVAVRHFEQAGTLLDSRPGALRQYGDCLMRLNETEKAISIFSHALVQPNADAGIRSRLASAQLTVHRPKDAIETLQPLLQEKAGDADVLDLAASAYEADGNTPEAVRLLHQAILTDPHNVDLYVDFANLSLDHQSYQVGVDVMSAGLSREPKAAPLYVARGILYVQLAQYDSAEADFEKADALDPKRSMGSAAEGLVAVEKNDPERALATVRAKLAKTPHDAYLLYLRAEIITQGGADPGSVKFHEAMESARKAVSLSPSLVGAHDVLAKLYIQAGQNGLAIEQCRKALKLDPKDQTALYHLIQALRKSGRTEDIPNLLKQLADLRMDATKKEAEHNRYKLVENKSPASEKP